VLRRTLLKWVIGTALWIMLALVVIFSGLIPPSVLPGGERTVAAVLVAVALFAGSAIDSIRDKFFVIAPHLEVVPETSAWSQKGDRRSQWVNIVRNSIPAAGQPMQGGSVTALFGILKVTAREGRIRRCKATARWRTKVPSHNAKTGENSFAELWTPGGTLNWFSETLQHNLGSRPVGPQNIGTELRNPEEDLLPSHPRDLIVSYLPNGCSFGFTCSDVVSAPIVSRGEGGEEPALLEVTFTGDEIEPVVQIFSVTHSVDRIEIKNSTVTE
jgi:hypothetical protein